MLNWDDIEQWGGRLAGAAGALVSMRFLGGTFFERLFSFIGGALFAFYSAEWIADKVGLPEGLTGFLLGLFGMAILNRTWEWMQTTNPVRGLLEFLYNRHIGRGSEPPKKEE